MDSKVSDQAPPKEWLMAIAGTLTGLICGLLMGGVMLLLGFALAGYSFR